MLFPSEVSLVSNAPIEINQFVIAECFSLWHASKSAKSFKRFVISLTGIGVSEKEKLSELAEEALIQTEDKNYQRDLEDRGINDIVRYSIAFSGKNVEVRTAR